MKPKKKAKSKREWIRWAAIYSDAPKEDGIRIFTTKKEAKEYVDFWGYTARVKKIIVREI